MNHSQTIGEIDDLIMTRLCGDASAVKMQSEAPLTISRLIEKGLAGETLKQMVQYIPRKVIIDTLGTDKSNFTKLYRRKLSKNQTDGLHDLSLLWRELRQFFDFDNELLNEWIITPLPVLDGHTPSEFMDTIVGRQKIRSCLEEMRYGITL